MIFPFKITNKNTNPNTNTNNSHDWDKMNLEKKEDRERGGPVETHGGSEAAGLRQWGMGTNGAMAGSGDAGMRVRVNEWVRMRVHEGEEGG